MSGLPVGWESDYDGNRWFYRFKPTGQTQFHFPKEGDEFPDFVDEHAPAPDLAPEEKLESQQQVRRRITTDGDQDGKSTAAKSRMRATAGPLGAGMGFGNGPGVGGGDNDDEDECTGFYYQPESFMFLGPGAYNDVSPIADEDDREDAGAKPEPQSKAAKPTEDADRSSKVSPLQSEATTPLVINSELARDSPSASEPATAQDDAAQPCAVTAAAQDTMEDQAAQATSPVVPLLDSREVPHELPASTFYSPVGIIAEMPTEATARARAETHPDPVELGDGTVLAPIETHHAAAALQPAIAELAERTSPVEPRPLAYSHDELQQTSMSPQLLHQATFGTQARPQNPPAAKVPAPQAQAEQPFKITRKPTVTGPKPSTGVTAEAAQPTISPTQQTATNAAADVHHNVAGRSPADAGYLGHVPSVLKPGPRRNPQGSLPAQQLPQRPDTTSQGRHHSWNVASQPPFDRVSRTHTAPPSQATVPYPLDMPTVGVYPGHPRNAGPRPGVSRVQSEPIDPPYPVTPQPRRAVPMAQPPDAARRNPQPAPPIPGKSHPRQHSSSLSEVSTLSQSSNSRTSGQFHTPSPLGSAQWGPSSTSGYFSPGSQDVSSPSTVSEANSSTQSPFEHSGVPARREVGARSTSFPIAPHPQSVNMTGSVPVSRDVPPAIPAKIPLHRDGHAPAQPQQTQPGPAQADRRHSLPAQTPAYQPQGPPRQVATLPNAHQGAAYQAPGQARSAQEHQSAASQGRPQRPVVIPPVQQPTRLNSSTPLSPGHLLHAIKESPETEHPRLMPLPGVPLNPRVPHGHTPKSHTLPGAPGQQQVQANGPAMPTRTDGQAWAQSPAGSDQHGTMRISDQQRPMAPAGPAGHLHQRTMSSPVNPVHMQPASPVETRRDEKRDRASWLSKLKKNPNKAGVLQKQPPPGLQQQQQQQQQQAVRTSLETYRQGQQHSHAGSQEQQQQPIRTSFETHSQVQQHNYPAHQQHGPSQQVQSPHVQHHGHPQPGPNQTWAPQYMTGPSASNTGPPVSNATTVQAAAHPAQRPSMDGRRDDNPGLRQAQSRAVQQVQREGAPPGHSHAGQSNVPSHVSDSLNRHTSDASMYAASISTVDISEAQAQPVLRGQLVSVRRSSEQRTRSGSTGVDWQEAQRQPQERVSDGQSSSASPSRDLPHEALYAGTPAGRNAVVQPLFSTAKQAATHDEMAHAYPRDSVVSAVSYQDPRASVVSAMSAQGGSGRRLSAGKWERRPVADYSGEDWPEEDWGRR